MKSLVVYYSRTNITEKLAKDIAGKTHADIEEIIPKVNYQGKMGYARGGKHAIQGKVIDLEALKYNPEDYDMIYLGAPVWAGKAATPLVSYIDQNKGKFSNVKLFTTAGSSGFEGALNQMEELCGISPKATFAATTKEVKKDEYDLGSFID